MSTINVIFGSTTGATQAAAEQIAQEMGGQAIAIADASEADFDADLVILGSSTWGFGELQDDWDANMEKLTSANLAGKKVAVFGQGDQTGFDSTFEDAMGIIAEAAEAAGATLVGAWPTEGYSHSDSRAVRGDVFVGLALDDSNEADKTPERITTWCAALKAAL